MWTITHICMKRQVEEQKMDKHTLRDEHTCGQHTDEWTNKRTDTNCAIHEGGRS